MTARCKYIGITGHRSLSRFKRAEARIRHAIRELVARYPRALWLAGGAVGADQIAVDELLKLDQRVRLMLPFAPSIMARRWPEACRRTLEEQIALAESVATMSGSYRVGAYHQRNRKILQVADLLVAFWDGIPFGSGTVSTIHEACQREIPVYWVPMR